MTRSEMYRRLRAHAGVWDMIVVGGGATGAGVAIDAARRGYDCPAVGIERFRQGDLQPQHQAGPRRRALPGARQPLARRGGAQGARTPAPKCSAPGAQSRFRRAQLRLVGSPFYGIGRVSAESASPVRAASL